MKVIYISGKITDKNLELENKNREFAQEYAIQLWKKGYAVICPHLNNNFKGQISWDNLIKGDLKLIETSDIVFMLPNWKESKGAKKEHTHAKKLNKEVIYGT